MTRSIILIIFFVIAFISYLPNSFSSVELEKALFHSKEPPSIIEVALLFSKEADPSLNLNKIKQKIKSLADEIRPQIQRTQDPKRKLEILRRAIYEKWKFQTPLIEGGRPELGYYDTLVRFSEESPEEIYAHSFLAPVVKNRQGNCLGLTSLYLALAEHLDLPLYPVVVPYHIFPRYDDGEIQINIETTAEGISLKNSFYVTICRMSEELIEKEVYLKTLPIKDLFSAYYLALGGIYSGKGLYQKSKNAYQKSLKLSPGLALAYTNLAFIYSYYGMNTNWNSEVKTAFEIDPNFLGGYLSLSGAFMREGKARDAIEVMETAVKKHPDVAHAYAVLAEFYLIEGRFDQSIQTVQKAIRLVNWEPKFYVTLAKAYHFKKDYNQAWIYARKAEKLGLNDYRVFSLLRSKSKEQS